jgi:hypothetical protein
MRVLCASNTGFIFQSVVWTEPLNSRFMTTQEKANYTEALQRIDEAVLPPHSVTIEK